MGFGSEAANSLNCVFYKGIFGFKNLLIWAGFNSEIFPFFATVN